MITENLIRKVSISSLSGLPSSSLLISGINTRMSTTSVDTSNLLTGVLPSDTNTKIYYDKVNLATYLYDLEDLSYECRLDTQILSFDRKDIKNGFMTVVYRDYKDLDGGWRVNNVVVDIHGRIKQEDGLPGRRVLFRKYVAVGRDDALNKESCVSYTPYTLLEEYILPDLSCYCITGDHNANVISIKRAADAQHGDESILYNLVVDSEGMRIWFLCTKDGRILNVGGNKYLLIRVLI